MENQILDNLLNLAFDATEEELSRSLELEVGYERETQEWEAILRYAQFEKEQLEEQIKRNPEPITVTELSGGYGIIRGSKTAIESFSQNPEIVYLEKPKRLYFAREQGKLASCMEFLQQEPDALSGKGILIGILDSGIDAAHPEFRNEDGTTRILAAWDQTGDGEPPRGFPFGTAYTREAINEILTEEEESSLPLRDLTGHGTAVAGIAAGKNGVAPQADLLIVKLGTPLSNSFPKTTELMMAVEYAYRKAVEYGKPLVLNLSFGTVYGSHNGSGLLETYLDEMMGRWKSVIVVGTGNEGNAAGHTSVMLQEGRQEEISLVAAAGERGLNIQLWKSYADQMTVFLRSPQGIQIGPLSENLGPQRYAVGDVNLLIYYGKPAPFQISQEIFFDFIPAETYVTAGVWRILLQPESVTEGNVDLWLPDAGVLNPATRFLRPTAENTLTLPSTARKVISVGAYDAANRIYASFSGRGNPPGKPPLPALSQTKPDLVAPGVEIRTTAPGGGYVTVNGTSFAAPFVSGAAAMMMQWGITDGNDPYLHGEKLRAYLQRGAQRLPGYREWPNNMVGYGALCVRESLPK